MFEGWAAAGAVVAAAGVAVSADSSRKAANTQADAAKAATESNDATAAQNRADAEPWRQAGMGALSQLSAGVSNGGEFNTQFQYDPRSDPGAQVRFQRGIDARDASASARGTLLSGGQLKALTDYGQDSASQEYQNSYNRWNNNVTNRFNRLASVAGIGQTATRDVAQMNTNATNMGNEYGLQGANANAAGTVARGNAINGGLSTLGNWWQGQSSNSGTSYNPGAGYGQGYSGSTASNQGIYGGDAGGSYWGTE